MIPHRSILSGDSRLMRRMISGRRGIIMMLLGTVLLAATVSMAQRNWRRQVDSRAGVPTWTNDVAFKNDVFTFVRIQYDSGYGEWRGGGRWATDYRDADLNLSFRLQQMTSLKVDPEGKILRLTDPDLVNHPFIYIVEPGALEFSEAEVKALREYLLNGGFLMVDDFWGEIEWRNFHEQMKRVFPEREPQELPLDHPIFHCVFDLKQKPQVASIGNVQRFRGTPYESYERRDAAEVHFKGLFDDKGRLMSIICHNTDLGDGWEREGEDEYYFREYAEKRAYPMMINIVFYAMTH